MVDERYVEYVRANKDKYPIESLKKALANSGASKTDIEEAVRLAGRPPAPAQVPPAPVFAAAPVPPPVVASPSGQAGSPSDYSHPDSPIRQSYPLSATEDGFFAALGLCLKTMPFILLRLGLLVGFTIVSVVWFVLTAGIGVLISKATSSNIGGWAFLIGLGAPAGLFYWFKRYVLYIVEMAHIAVLTRLITHGELEGGNQISYGKDLISSRFGEINALLVLQALVDGVVRTFIGSVNFVTSFLPLGELRGLIHLVEGILRNATKYVVDVIFSYNIARGDENTWRSSKDGLVYYAQNWKPVLKTATYALILEYILSFFNFLILLIPAAAVGHWLPRVGAWFFLLAIVVALNIKSAVLRPLFSTMVALTYHKTIHNQPIDIQMDQTLTSLSDKFREISERAKNWAAGKIKGFGPAAAPS